MLRTKCLRVLVAAVVILYLLGLAGTSLAQGRRDRAFERVREVQERHTQKMMAKEGIVGTARFIGQIVVSPGTFSSGGDSGSLVATEDGDYPVGLLFAGGDTDTIANPIDLVLSRFGVTVDGQ